MLPGTVLPSASYTVVNIANRVDYETHQYFFAYLN